MGIARRTDASDQHDVSSATVGVTLGVTPVDGDRLIAVITGLTTTDPSAAPSGWTLLGSQAAGTTEKLWIYYKDASGETGTYSWTMGATVKCGLWVGCYSGVDTSSPPAFNTAGTTSTGTAITVPALTIAGAGDWALYGAGCRHTATGAASTFTTSGGSDSERVDHGSNAGSGTDYAMAVYESTPGAGSLSRTITSTISENQVSAWSVALVELPPSIGRPFLPTLLGSDARIATEIAPGADLSADPSTWTWVDITSDVRHVDGTSTTIGRADNVGTTPAASHSCGLNNPNGDYSPLDPMGAHFPNITRNMPVRQRLTIDGSTYRTRFQGYLQSLVPTSNLSGGVSVVSLGAAGMLARIAGRKRPLKSPLYRATAAIPDLFAFWPMEDGNQATSFGSAVGGRPLAGTAAITFADAGPAGGLPLPKIAPTDAAGAVYTAAVAGPAVASGQGFCVSVVARVDDTAKQPVLCQFTTSTGNVFQIQILSDAVFGAGLGGGVTTLVNAAFPLGVATLNGSDVAGDGDWHLYQISLMQVGADLWYRFCTDGDIHDGSFQLFTAGVTLGSLTSMQIGAAGTDFTTPTGYTCHVGYLSACSITSGTQTPHGPELTAAIDGHSGETASDRLTRLCSEESITLDLTGTSDVTMGPQPLATLLAALQECEAADHGILYDGLGPGIGYVCRSSVYAQAAAYALDMSAQQVTTPTTGYLDMQGITNIVAGSRANGATVTYERTDGASGTDSIGDEDTAQTWNVDSDDVLIFHDQHVAALGTPDGQRVPQITPNLRVLDATTLGALIAAGPRHRVDITSPQRRELGPDSLRLLVEGWKESTAADSWGLVLNTSPFAPYDVLVLDDGDARLAAGDASTLAADITSSATSFTVDIASGPLWTTDAADFPLDIVIGGERITLGSPGVAGISGASSPQTFTASARSVNGIVKAHSSGDAVEVWRPAVLGL